MKKILYVLLAAALSVSFTAAVHAGCKAEVKKCWKSLKGKKKELSKEQRKAGKKVRKFCKKKKNKAKCKKAVEKFASVIGDVGECGAVSSSCNPVADDDVPDGGDVPDSGSGGGGF